MKFKKIPEYLYAPIALAFAAFTLLIITANNYGIFSDELYFYACAEHLQFGYVDHPALVAWATRLNILFGKSLYVLRIFPSLAFSASIVLTAVIANKLGGGRFASFLASLSVVCGFVFWAIFGYFSMNSFDVLFISLAAYLFVLILQKESLRLWIILGIVVGLGLNTKMTMAVFSFSLFAGILLTNKRRVLLTRQPYIAAIIAFLMFLPNILWQAANNWATLEFIRQASDKNLDISIAGLIGQLSFSTNIFLLPVWIAGIVRFFRNSSPISLRPLGVTVIVFFAVYSIGNSKFYYLLPAMPLLMASGSAAFERWTSEKRKWLRIALVVPVVLAGLLTLPFGLTILPIETFAAYSNLFNLGNKMQTENNEAKMIPSFYGQRFSWYELAQKTAEVYYSLPVKERAECGILGFHYSDAGCIDYFGSELGLPKAMSRHMSYWLWGPTPGYSGKTTIIIVSGDARVEKYFKSTLLAATYKFRYIEGSNGLKRIYICRDLIDPIPILWQKIQTYR